MKTSDMDSVSFATTEAMNGLKIFLKEDKSIIPYKVLYVNVYTITRNVYNHLRPDPLNYTHKDKKRLEEMLITELNYLNNVLTLDIKFYMPKVKEPKKPKGKVTKVALNNINIYKMANEISKRLQLSTPTKGAIILTNSLAGITNLNNPILRSFTGDVLFKKEHYKLLKRSPPVEVNKDILSIFGDDLVQGVTGKVKEVNKLLGLIKEKPFKLNNDIKRMISNLSKGV